MAKYKEDANLKKRNPVYVVDIAKNITESSSTPQTEEQKKVREEHEARRARRRANDTRKKLSTVHDDIKQEKSYDLYSMYHQLNYNLIQKVIKECGVKPAIINNSYLVIPNLRKEKLEEVKQKLLECHFETKSKKQYKVRVVWYTSKEHNEKIKVRSVPSNNSKSVAASAKNVRKDNKKTAFDSRSQHATGRKANKILHLPGVKDTSGILRKITIRARKACKYLERKEKEVKMQNSCKKQENHKKSTKAIQQTFNF